MIKVIGVRFRHAGKIYYFDPVGLEIKKDDNVIVETARGVEFGTVVSGCHDVPEESIVSPLKPVIRMATEADVEIDKKNREKEAAGFNICLEKIAKRGLDMKLIKTEVAYEGKVLIFYFTSDKMIDYRMLVKDLVDFFKVRIELRQVRE